jgi:hypothetical protein
MESKIYYIAISEIPNEIPDIKYGKYISLDDFDSQKWGKLI